MQVRLLASVLVVLVSIATLGVAAEGQERPDRPLRVAEYRQGQVFCPTSALVSGRIVIRSGRCYTLFLIREERGVFLAFGPPSTFIPPGQIVRLSTPAGAKAKGRILYWVPLPTTAVLMPVNTITPVGVRVQDSGPRVSFILTGVAAPNITLVFKTDLNN